MIGAWGRMVLPDEGLRLDEIWYYITFYGGGAIPYPCSLPFPLGSSYE